jgi:hypothetical protein
MALPLAFRHTALGVDTSNLTGAPLLVADWRQITLSIVTQTTTASQFTVIGTNEDGLQAALSTPSQTVNGAWSILTTLTGQGIYELSPGFRWLNVFRPSASSATVVFAGRT